MTPGDGKEAARLYRRVSVLALCGGPSSWEALAAACLGACASHAHGTIGAVCENHRHIGLQPK